MFFLIFLAFSHCLSHLFLQFGLQLNSLSLSLSLSHILALLMLQVMKNGEQLRRVELQMIQQAAKKPRQVFMNHILSASEVQLLNLQYQCQSRNLHIPQSVILVSSCFSVCVCWVGWEVTAYIYRGLSHHLYGRSIFDHC